MNQPKEIAEFLKKERGNPFRNFFILGGKTRKGLGLLSEFLRGRLNLKEFILSLQSVNKRPIEITLKRQKVIDQSVINYLKRKNLLFDDFSLNLFGRKFYFINPEDVLGSICQLILDDEHKIKKFVKEDSVVFDVGANIGVFSVFAANIATRGKVFAFEPVSFLFDILKKNITNYQNIEIFNIGLGSQDRKEEIFVRSWAPGDSTINVSEIERNKESFDRKEIIEIVKLDDFAKQKNIPRIDFIKIDVEGYEIEVLKGSIETIKEYKPVLSISLHKESFKDEIEKIIQEQNINYLIEINKQNESDIFLIPKNER